MALFFLNLLFYSVLGFAFAIEGAAFNLGRHGLFFSWDTLALGFFYYALVAWYVVVHSRRGIVLVDAYNIFIFFFSVLIVPGVLAASPEGSDLTPHYMTLISGCCFMLPGLTSEIAFKRRREAAGNVKFSHNIKNETIAVLCLIFLACVLLVLFSGNLNRAGVFFVIQDFLLSTDTVDANAVAQYRAEVYYESSNIVSVIGNYAGGVFGVFFALIIYVHFMRRGDWLSKTIALSVVLFPLVFALGTGSRLLLLRTLMIYFAFAVIPTGLRVVDWRLLGRASLMFAVLITSTAILGRGVQGENAAQNLVVQTEKSIKRLLLVKGSGSLWVYDYYPAAEDFELGVPIIERLSGIEIDGEPSVANKIFSYRYGGASGTAGPQTFGDFYASFGYFGQFILAPLWAIVLLWLRGVYARKKSRGTVERAFWSIMMVSVGYTGYSDFGSFKAIGVVYLSFIYIFFKILARSARNLLRRSQPTSVTI